MSDACTLLSWKDACRRFRAALIAAQIDQIFFEASATKSFTDDDARSAFHDKWLGRYLTHFPDMASVAICEDGEQPTVAGYIVGAVGDPAKDPRFADISYFSQIADYTARYPAHLHVNLALTFRSRGLGGRLVSDFADKATAMGATGVHIVTSAQSRNVSFYRRQGFEVLVTKAWSGHEVVMMGALLPLGSSAASSA